jgi:hypothetical protein
MDSYGSIRGCMHVTVADGEVVAGTIILDQLTVTP